MAICFNLVPGAWLGKAEPGDPPRVRILAGPITNPANQHQYYVLEPSSWTEAEAAAVAMGGHLATVNDPDEDRWIQNNCSPIGGAGRSLWIGLHDLDPALNSTNGWERSQEFAWSSGQKVDFYKWPSPNEPDTNPGTEECYVQMLPPAQYGSWADRSNTTLLSGLAEVPRPLEISVPPQGGSVRLGGAARLSVIADGTSPIRYQWQFLGTNLPGATEAWLALTNFQAAQAGAYAVVVSNDSGSLSSQPVFLTARTVLAWSYPWIADDGEANTTPASLTNVVALARGADHALALRADGTVAAWGDNQYGQSQVPTGLAQVTAIACGGFFSLALKADGTVVGWGHADSIRPAATLSNVVAISASVWHGLAVKEDGTVIAWNGSGDSEPPVPLGLGSIRAVAAGARHSLALKADGTVAAWGDNFYGQTTVPEGLADVVALAAGDRQSLALKADGRVVGWGDKMGRQPLVPRDLAGVVAIAAEGNVSLALKSDGTVVSWGSVEGTTAASFPPMIAMATGGGLGLGLAGDSSPHLTIQPSPLSVRPGEDVILGAKAVGGQPLAYQWQCNRLDIPGATQDVYRMHPAKLTDAGIYTLVVTNALGAVTSRPAEVKVSAPTNHAPMLTSQADRTINTQSRLRVVNTAIDPDIPADHLSYQLVEAPQGATIDDQGIIEWHPLPADAASRNVFTTVVTDAGAPPLSATNRFTVVVLSEAQTGTAGIVAGPIDYAANGHRYFLLEPASWTTAEATAAAMGGHLVTINDQEEHIWVRATFSSYGGTPRALWIGLSDPDPSATWEMGFEAWMNHFVWASGQPVTFFCWSTMEQPSQGAGRIKMCRPDPAWPHGQAEWAEEADATSLHGVVEIPLRLQIIAQPASVSVGMGRNAILTVVADGTDALQYQWQFMGTNLPGATTSTLSIDQATPAQSGPYTVVVSSRSGTLTSDVAWVAVAGVLGWGISAFGPLDVPAGATNVVALAAGSLHGLALRADGSILAWGDNRMGQINVPPGITNAVAITAGPFSTFALRRDGTVIGWGDDTFGQLNIPSDLTNAVGIAAGFNHCLAVRSDRTVTAWGALATPPSDLTQVVAVAVGGLFDLALRADGTVAAWGNEAWNADVRGLSNVVAIAAGESHGLALLADGTVRAWGNNLSGETAVPRDLTNAVAISARGSHSLALGADGRVFEWGETMGNVPRPGDLPNVVAVAAGNYFTLALLEDGAPHLTLQPWDQSVPAGSQPCFTAKAVGLQAMRYQWQFNGKDIEGATKDVLVVADAQPADAGLYSVIVANARGARASRSARLVVGSGGVNPEPPVLTAWGWTNGLLRLRVSGPIGPQYVLEASASLTNWTSLQTNAPSATPFFFIDGDHLNAARRFYRVRY